MSNINEIIKSDLYRYGGLKGTKGFVKAFFIPGFRFTYFFRNASVRKKYSVLGFVLRLIVRKYSFKYGFQIPVKTQIGKGFYLGHFGAVVINSKTIIGNYCNIAQGVTIGQANRGELKGTPVIGDKVWIGTNAVIVGKIKVGSNILIAPNSYVNFDVPDNSIVIGNPAKIIERSDATEKYIEYFNEP